jgi:enhancing lycopene biosynthesis protein 2
MAQKKKIGVVLSGCGFLDGAEIHEAVLTLLALDRAGAQAICFAPNIPQRHVVNHVTGEEMAGDVRNVLTESARIARGKIQDISKAKVAELSGAILPGGFGAAKNLSSFAIEGTRCRVEPSVAKFLKAVHAAGKPLGFLCIAPVLAAKVFGAEGVEVTIGNDKATATAVEDMGAKHVSKAVVECHVDTKRKVVSAPAYMLDEGIARVSEGIEKLVAEVLALA